MVFGAPADDVTVASERISEFLGGSLTCRIIETVLFLSRDPLSRKSRARAIYAFAYMSENV